MLQDYFALTLAKSRGNKKASTPNYRELMIEEAALGSMFAEQNLPYVLPAKQVSLPNGEIGILMPFLSRGNIVSYIAELETPRTERQLEEILSIAICSTEAVQALHDLGFIHRDVKPENLLLGDKPGTVHLCDFGLTKKKTLSIHQKDPFYLQTILDSSTKQPS